MCFVKSLTHMIVCPILHRNMNKFMAMADMEHYMTYKVIHDQMFAMTPKGEIFSWNLMTGKYISRIASGQDFSEYELYSKYKGG